MQVALVMFRSDGHRRSFPLRHDVTVIGRREDCDLRVPLGDVSRKHCQLSIDPLLGTATLTDLGSSNGTYLNGQRVTGETAVNPGDTIKVGPVQFVVQIDGQPADDALQPFSTRASAARLLEDSTAAANEIALAADEMAAEGRRGSASHGDETLVHGEPTVDEDLALNEDDLRQAIAAQASHDPIPVPREGMLSLNDDGDEQSAKKRNADDGPDLKLADDE